jgi:hypothetical protein
VSLGRAIDGGMKERRLAKPKEKATRVSRKTVIRLYEQYAELQRLREEVRRLVASETKAEQSDRS